MKIFFITVPIIGAIFFNIIAINVFLAKLQPIAGLKEIPTIINLSKGTSFNEIADKLYSAGLIESKTAFKIYSLVKGNAHRLQGGKYKFDSAVSIPELVGILTAGPKDVSVVIFPGMTLKEIDDKLSEENIINKGNLINYGKFETLKNRHDFLSGAISLEGFLLPDTYNFKQDSDIESVIEKILNNFENKVMPIIAVDDFNFSSLVAPLDKKTNDLLRLIIIASYLEKEIPDNEERRVVAGIIEKRLKIRMPLQIDATILYNKCFGRFFGCSLLVKDDFKKDSPYNTYIRLGLTPTPISNPGLEAIKSAIEKKDSNYLYYISDPKTKKTIFSENLEKHNTNRAKYLLKSK